MDEENKVVVEEKDGDKTTEAVVSQESVQEEVSENPAAEVSLESVLQEVQEVRKDVGGCLDACREIAKTVGELTVSMEKMRKAGRFIFVLCLTSIVGSSII